METKEAIKIIVDKKQGSSSELKLLIGDDTFQNFCLMGFINNNFNHWKITKLGNKQWDFYRKPNFKERLLGLYLHSIGF